MTAAETADQAQHALGGVQFALTGAAVIGLVVLTGLVVGALEGWLDRRRETRIRADYLRAVRQALTVANPPREPDELTARRQRHNHP